jgi:hypothetical protein
MARDYPSAKCEQTMNTLATTDKFRQYDRVIKPRHFAQASADHVLTINKLFHRRQNGLLWAYFVQNSGVFCTKRTKLCSQNRLITPDSPPASTTFTAAPAGVIKSLPFSACRYMWIARP